MKSRIALALAGVALMAVSASAATYEMKPGEWRASKLTGVNVYNPNNDKIGDIKELIIGKNGSTEAVVVAAGGFLGMGEHDVAVPFNQVKWSDEPRDHATTTSNRTAATADRNAATMPNQSAAVTNHDATTTADNANREAYRGYPDHAVLDMTKDQLKALPEVSYAR